MRNSSLSLSLSLFLPSYLPLSLSSPFSLSGGLCMPKSTCSCAVYILYCIVERLLLLPHRCVCVCVCVCACVCVFVRVCVCMCVYVCHLCSLPGGLCMPKSTLSSATSSPKKCPTSPRAEMDKALSRSLLAALRACARVKSAHTPHCLTAASSACAHMF